ncbi:MAG: hypothetical protein ACE5EU_00850 [Paracoccaceae bacterium]
MSVLVAFLHRYLSPFFTGVCAAGATVVDNVPMIVVLVLATALFGFLSLPAGGRMIGRIAGMPS